MERMITETLHEHADHLRPPNVDMATLMAEGDERRRLGGVRRIVRRVKALVLT